MIQANKIRWALENKKMQANKIRSAISELDMRHGSPYDRGAADSYYQRPFEPHYFVKDTYNSPRISAANMSAAEVALYARGFTDNEERGQFKDWGSPYAHVSRDMGEDVNP